MSKVILHLPPLWKNPEAVADQFRFINCPKRISLAATGTKVGKTFGCSIWLIRNAISTKDSLWWWTAPYRKTAKIGYSRVKSLLPPGKYIENKSDLSIYLPHNGTLMDFRTGENPDALYGEGVMGCVVDEGGRIKEDAWTALNTTMLQTQGPMRIASNTDRGRRNWLYKEYLRGQTDDPEIQSWHIRTPDAPHFMAGGKPGPIAIENMRKKLSALSFRAIVLAEFPEDAATVFPGLSQVIIDEWNGYAFDEDRLPFEFQIPAYEGGYFIGGLDLASRRDWTVITVMDARSGLVVYWARFQHLIWAEQLRKVKDAQEQYGCQFLVDATPGSVGDPLLEQLQMGGVNAEGFAFTNRTKRWLVEKLAVTVQERDIKIPNVLKQLISELEELEREVTEAGNVIYSAPEGEDSFDDSVFSLALANWLRDTMGPIQYVSGGERYPTRGGISRRGFLGE
jgi:hypothetical protein